MKRITDREYDGEAILNCDGFLGSDHICDCEDCLREATYRLAMIEDILGDEYDLDRLREMVEESKQIDKMLKVGDDVWYVDFDKGDIEKGKVETVNYKNGKLDCFGVDFEDDFDVFDGSGWGKYFFGSELNARKALLKGDKL